MANGLSDTPTVLKTWWNCSPSVADSRWPISTRRLNLANGHRTPGLSILSRSQIAVRLQTSPEIPTRHRAIRTPPSCNSLHLGWQRHFFHPVCLADGVADSQIAHRKNVRAPQRE